jgi:hypothetical protein
MVDQHNSDIPAVGNLISADIADIEENLEWHKDVLQMLAGWKDSTIGSVGPAPHRATFAYSDTDTITIGAGSYFHDGTVRQTVFWDAAITFDLGSGGSNALSDELGVSEWHYIYLDDSAIVTQADSELDADCFLNDTTAPSWSAAKHGWYNGSDRCIFAVLTNGSSQILEFFHNEAFVLFADGVTDRAQADLDTTWTDVTLSIPGFSQMAQALFACAYVDGASQLFWRTNGQTGTTGHAVGNADADTAVSYNTVMVITDSSQKIEVKHSASNANTTGVNTEGFYLPNGM